MPSPFDGLHAIGVDETSYRKGHTHLTVVVDHERLRAASPADAGSFGWAVLGFFIPLVGLILWMIWKNDRPGDAGMAGKGALVSAIINVVLFILWIVFAGILFAASGSY